MMNRTGAVPQLRGIPTGFGGQQQPQQPGRSAAGRLPNGKLGNNGSGWAFGGVPMSGAGLPNSSRQLGANISFAQSLSGSQPATPLDPSIPFVKNRNMAGPKSRKERRQLRKEEEREAKAAKSSETPNQPDEIARDRGDDGDDYEGEFPSLSNNSQLSSANPSSMWSSNSRNMPLPRNQSTPLSSQQGQQDDLFPSSRINTGSFRFGTQTSIGQPSQPQPGSIDDFPPLNNSSFRNGSGEIGQERTSNLMSTLGFGAQPSSAAPSLQGSRVGNGLLNALSANTRATEGRSPDASNAPGSMRTQDLRSVLGADEPRQKPPGFREDSLVSQSSVQDAQAQSSEIRNPPGIIGNDAPGGKAKDDKDEQSPAVHDPLGAMAPIDKWGIKGHRTLMNNYPDYNAAITGVDPTSFNLPLQSNEPISTQIYSPYNDLPPRPAVPKHQLPDCYSVTNVQPIENKIQSFNEETLMMIFYSCPGDIKQHMAALELNNRNWRWHKKLQLWLTKDDAMAPRMLGPNHEQGYYVIWNTELWGKERRELILHYADLDAPGQ